MQMNRRNALAAFAAAAVPGAWTQDRYPSRPIRIIVTNAAGGASDMIARMIGTGLTAALGQTVTVEGLVERKWIEAGAGLVELSMQSRTERGVTVGPGRVVVELPLP